MDDDQLRRAHSLMALLERSRIEQLWRAGLAQCPDALLIQMTISKENLDLMRLTGTGKAKFRILEEQRVE